MTTAARTTIVGLICALVIFLAALWIRSDWVYCQINGDFVQHSWNTNWHNCSVDKERSTYP